MTTDTDTDTDTDTSTDSQDGGGELSVLAPAVAYLRVSTAEQARRGGRPEGYSIPAQRAAVRTKATELGAVIVEEFVDAGASAKTADRPELQRMLTYVATHPVTFCIVHKIDRLARNRLNDVTIHLDLTTAGVQLVSDSEAIDETPAGARMHGMVSSMAEFYFRNLAAEVSKGMSEKARQGGTPTRAPIGYRNIRTINSDGRETRTVELDPGRAQPVAWAFETYASGTVPLSPVG